MRACVRACCLSCPACQLPGLSLGLTDTDANLVAHTQAADTAEADRLLKIKEAAESKGDAPAEGLVAEDAFLFVVFDGGNTSVAEVLLPAAPMP